MGEGSMDNQSVCLQGEELAARVEEQWNITHPLVNAACEAAEVRRDSLL